MTTPEPLTINIAVRSGSGKTRHLTRRVVTCHHCGATGQHTAAHADEPDGACAWCEGTARIIEQRNRDARWTGIAAGDRHNLELAGFDPVEARARFDTAPTGPLAPVAFDTAPTGSGDDGLPF